MSLCNRTRSQTFVSEVTAAATAARSAMSTKVVRMPHLAGKKDLSSAKVPPYTAFDATMWSPLPHSCSRLAEMAAMPELHAYPACVPSRAASWRPRYRTVGLKLRPYR